MSRNGTLPLTPSEYFNVRHDESRVVIRMITNPLDPEYDPRIDLPLDEEFIADLRRRGQLQPALGYKAGMDGDAIVVVLTVGRQRWKSILEIWSRMRAEGADMKHAPAFKIIVSKAKDPASRREERFAENCHRAEFGGIEKAREVARQLEIVGDDERGREDVRILFNFKSPAAMDNCLALLDTTPKVQGLLTAGAISPTAALQLARQEPAVQDAVAERIEDESEGEDESAEDEADSDAPSGLQIDAFGAPDDGESAATPERTTRTKSVSEVKEMIRDAHGQASYNLVTLKQIEKELERKEKEREKLVGRFEENPGWGEKRESMLTRIGAVDGYLEALRWARGESVTTSKGGASASNDKASAAWDTLTKAILEAPWPKIRLVSEMCAIPDESERDEAIRQNSRLVVAGEVVAVREFYSDDSFRRLYVNTDTKFFLRLMDPYGKLFQVIRDFAAHGWIEPASESTGQLRWTLKDFGRVMIVPIRPIAEGWASESGWIFDGVANQETMPLETAQQDEQVAEVAE